MRVRVYDPKTDSCFYSELYALLHDGVAQRCLVAQDGLLRLYYQTLPENGSYRTQAGFIDPAFPEEWLCLTNGDLPKDCSFPKRHSEDSRSLAFRGYPFVWADQKTLLRLLEGEIFPLAETGWPPVSSLLPGWRYVIDAQGAETLLHEAHSFHDTVLAELGYVSGSKRLPDGSMLCSDRTRQARLLFHCDWTPPIELVFEGVRALHLHPSGTNGCSILFEASCRARNAMVVFCDGWCEEGKEGDYEGTSVWAYSLRWRFLPQGTGSLAEAGNIGVPAQ